MPNGAPGDHPVTDIVIHGNAVYSPLIDGLVREIVELGGRDRVELMLFRDYNPHGDPDLVALEAELREVLDELRGD